MDWVAQLLDGTPPTLVTYAVISRLIQNTPASQRRRLADGSLVIGMWHFRRRS